MPFWLLRFYIGLLNLKIAVLLFFPMILSISLQIPCHIRFFSMFFFSLATCQIVALERKIDESGFFTCSFPLGCNWDGASFWVLLWCLMIKCLFRYHLAKTVSRELELQGMLQLDYVCKYYQKCSASALRYAGTSDVMLCKKVKGEAEGRSWPCPPTKDEHLCNTKDIGWFSWNSYFSLFLGIPGFSISLGTENAQSSINQGFS